MQFVSWLPRSHLLFLLPLLLTWDYSPMQTTLLAMMMRSLPLIPQHLLVFTKWWTFTGEKLCGTAACISQGLTTVVIHLVEIWDILGGFCLLVGRNSSLSSVMTNFTVTLTVTLLFLILGGNCPTSSTSCSDIGNLLSSSLFHMMKRYSLIMFQMPITFEQTSGSDSRNSHENRPRPISRQNSSRDSLPIYVPAPLARSESELQMQERGRREQGRRIIRIGSHQVVQPQRSPTPPPTYVCC